MLRDRAIAAGIEKKTTKAAIDRKARYLEITDSLIADCFDTDKDGNIRSKLKIEKVKDLKDAIELALKLIGEPESRSDHNLFFEWVKDHAE
jgi:hypothetical protein